MLISTYKEKLNCSWRRVCITQKLFISYGFLFGIALIVVVKGDLASSTIIRQKQSLSGGPTPIFSSLTPDQLKPVSSNPYSVYYSGMPDKLVRRRKRDPITFSAVLVLGGIAAYKGYQKYKARNKEQPEVSKVVKPVTLSRKQTEKERLYQAYQTGAIYGQQQARAAAAPTTQSYMPQPPMGRTARPSAALLTEDEKYQQWKKAMLKNTEHGSSSIEVAEPVKLDSQMRDRSEETKQREYQEYLYNHEAMQDKNEIEHHIREDDREQQHNLDKQLYEAEGTVELTSEEQEQHKRFLARLKAEQDEKETKNTVESEPLRYNLHERLMV